MDYAMIAVAACGVMALSMSLVGWFDRVEMSPYMQVLLVLVGAICIAVLVLSPTLFWWAFMAPR